MLATLLPLETCLERSRPVREVPVTKLLEFECVDAFDTTLLCLLRCEEATASALFRFDVRSGIGGSTMLGARDETEASDTGVRSLLKDGGTGNAISAPEEAVRRRW